MKFIRTLTQLKRLAQYEGIECFIAFRGGLRSSKFIRFNKSLKNFWVFNYIDDTELCLSEKELKEDTNIYKAIKKGCLILD